MSDAFSLTNARLVLPDEVVLGSLEIRGGEIASIDAGTAAPRDAVDCEGHYVCPGLIELHTDNLERHLEPRPGAKWPLVDAIISHDGELASVGVTTVFDALRVGSLPSSDRTGYGAYARETVSEIIRLRAAGALRISHFIHLRAEICSETLTEELGAFGGDDRIGIVSMMDHTPGQRQYADPTQLRYYLKRKYSLADDEIEAHMRRLLEVKARYGEEHERVAVARAQELGAILASHDDTTPGHVAESASLGVRLAEFPTTLEAAEACASHGVAVMMGAPNLLRGGSHSGNVSAAALAEIGRLDILSSDYAPSSLLAAAVRWGDRGGDLAAALKMTTLAPAMAAGLSDRGALRVGLRADLVRFFRVGDAAVVKAAWVRGQRAA